MVCPEKLLRTLCHKNGCIIGWFGGYIVVTMMFLDYNGKSAQYLAVIMEKLLAYELTRHLF